MSEPGKNPFDLLLDQIRAVVREELKAASNGNGHAPNSPEMPKGEQQRLKILAAAKAAVEAGALLTAEQLAVMLQVNKATVYERVKKKAIPFYQAGRFVRFNLQEVLESQRKKNEHPLDS
jgi:excisionase family DNA binding protein